MSPSSDDKPLSQPAGHLPPGEPPAAGTVITSAPGRMGPAPRTVYEGRWLRKGWAMVNSDRDADDGWQYVWRYSPEQAKRQGRRQTFVGLALLAGVLVIIILSAILVSALN